jgi:hypothetical protein
MAQVLQEAFSVVSNLVDATTGQTVKTVIEDGFCGATQE